MKQVLLVLLLSFFSGAGLASGQDTSQHPLITIQNAGQVHELSRLGEGRITDIVWSANAQTLVVGTTLDVYVYTQGQISPLVLDEVGLSYPVLSDDGQFLAGTQVDNGIRVWNLVTNEEKTISAIDPVPGLIRFFPGSSFLLARTQNELQVWDAATGELVHHVPNNFPGIQDMSPDMQHIIGFWKDTQLGSGREFTSILAWDGDTGDLVSGDMGVEGAWIVQHAFHPIQNSILAVLHANGVVRVWDIERNQLLYALTLPYDLVSTIAFGPDGQVLATGGTDGKIRLWDAATGALLEVLPDQLNDVGKITIGSDNRIIAFYEDYHEAHAWDARTGQVLAEVVFPEDLLPGLHRVSFNANSDQIIAVGGDGTVHFWDAVTEEKEGVWAGVHPDERTAWASNFAGGNSVFSQDRNYLAVLDQQTGELFLWHLDGGIEPIVMQTPVDEIGTGLAFSGDNRWLSFGSVDEGLWLWEFDQSMNRTTQESMLMPRYDGAIYSSTAFSPTEPLVSYMLDDPDSWGQSQLYLHNIETGETQVIAAVDRAGSVISFSPNGTLLALRQPESLRFWNVKTGRLEDEFNVCGFPTTLVFSPDGSLVLLSCGSNLELYDTQSGEKLNTLIGPDYHYYVESAAFNADGTLIVTAGTDGTVRLWGVE